MSATLPNELIRGFIVLLLVGFPAVGTAAIVCGQTISVTTTLAEDLVCPSNVSPALSIVGADVTLNLGGHTLKGVAVQTNPTTGIMVQGAERIAITNGTIEGFDEEIAIFNATQVTIRNLTIRNLEIADPDHYLVGVHVHDSHDVLVEDSKFRFLPVIHRDAVIQYFSSTTIRNNDMDVGMVGVSFYPVCDPASAPNNSKILNNKFSNTPLAIWVACTNNTRISGNTFIDNHNPIQGDAPFAGAVTGLKIEDNVITTTVGPSLGIQFRGVRNSTVENNTVKGNDAWGITIGRSLGCIDPVNNPAWDCFYSTNNLIRCNVALENGTDLYHDVGSTPNTWENNTCQTQQGADIPPCDGHEKCLAEQDDFPWEIFMPAILHGVKKK